MHQKNKKRQKYHRNQIFNSRDYAELCNEWRGTSPRVSAWATQKRRGGGEPLVTLSDLTAPGIEPETSHASNDVSNHNAKSWRKIEKQSKGMGALPSSTPLLKILAKSRLRFFSFLDLFV